MHLRHAKKSKPPFVGGEDSWVGMPRRRWLQNFQPEHGWSRDGTTQGASLSMQVRVEGRRRGIVCGRDEVILVTTTLGCHLIKTHTNANYKLGGGGGWTRW